MNLPTAVQAPRIRAGAALVLLLVATIAAFVLGRISAAAANRIAGAAFRSSPHPAIIANNAPAEREWSAVLERLTPKLTSEAGLDEFIATLIAWAATDPAGALEYARQHLDRDGQDAAYRGILAAWATRAPQAAWQWACTHDADNALHIDPVLTTVGKTNPDLAWKFATEFGQKYPATANLAYSSALVGITFAGDYAAATRLIEQAKLPAAPDGTDGKYDLASVLVSQWARYEPDRAAAWAQTLPASSIAHERSLVNLSQAWAEVDPRRAVDYATKLPAGAERGMVITQTLTSWLDHDLSAASGWINERPADPDFDNAVYQIATDPRVVDRDPLTALSWANSLTDVVRRQWSIGAILQSWQQRDPAAARRYLESSSELTAEMRVELLEQLEKANRR